MEGTELKCGLLEGDEEKAFLDEMVDELVKHRQKLSKHNKNKGGNRFNRKRKGGSDSGPHSKRNKWKDKLFQNKDDNFIWYFYFYKHS